MRGARLLLSAGLAVASASLALVVTASPGHAAAMLPDAGHVYAAASTTAASTATTADRATRAERRLTRQLARRSRALSSLSRRAARYDRELQGLRETLAIYGYYGDPSAAEVILPIANYRLSAGFGLTGPLWVAEHGGQDFGASSGEPLVAVGEGTVTEVGDAGAYGLRTILQLHDGTEIWYCHQTTASVLPGDVVQIADEIGTVGSTGNSTGPHLHLEVRPNGGAPVNPMTWFAAAGLAP